MDSQVLEQLSENEYEKFGTLFRCSDTDILTSKLTDVLKVTLRNGKENQASNIAIEINKIFLEHFDKIQIQIDFYESPHSEGYEEAKEINDERIRSEKKFEKTKRYFEQIKERCSRYEAQVNKIGYSIPSTHENRKKYPLHPPAEFLNENDIIALEKFLHWDVFLSNAHKQDPDVGHPYLYMDLASQVGAGGLDVGAQHRNIELTKKLVPILSKAGLSVQTMAIIIWAHQYFISQRYYARHEHSKNFFIPSLSSLVKEINKILKGKT